LRVAARSLSAGELPYGILSGRKEALDRAIIAIVEDNRTSQVAAFSAMAFLRCEIENRSVTVVHSGLTIVRPEHQGLGLTWRLTRRALVALLARNLGRPFWLTSVSQVPAAIGMFCEGTEGAFPAPQNPKPSVVQQAIAGELMTRHRAVFGVGDDAEFCRERFIIRNAYTGGSDNLKKRFCEAPRHRRPEINAMCAAELDYERGDDFLQVGQVTLRTVMRGVLRGAGLR
jgi:hypothetical protein